MAISNTPNSPSAGIWGAVKGALGLFSDINKTYSDVDNSFEDTVDEFESSYSETEVIQLVSQWKRTYAAYYGNIEPSQELAFSYWLGKQQIDERQEAKGDHSVVDNKIFQAVETFIPIATRANPDPLVQADPSAIGQQLAKSVKNILVYEADRQKLRKILKKALRHWLIYKIACVKISYNVELDEIETEAINPKRFVFDKDGHIDEEGFFTGEYIGEKKKLIAAKLIELFPRKKEVILQKCQGKLGTKLEFFEWWYQGKDIFYTMDEVVLGKFKNPHWNYDFEPKTTLNELGEEETLGNFQKGINFFKKPRAPYVFLSIFSTGLQPHDETSLIAQNISLQDVVNRRYRQIDKNAEGMNNGIIISDQFTDAQASQAAAALRRGQAIRVPGSDVTKAAMRFPPGQLPEIVFSSMKDAQNEIANIFGTAGSTPEAVDNQDTVRGKILVNQLDSSRIGGGITEYLEQVADSIYCWWVQMMYVHYTNDHFVLSAGEVDGTALVQIKNTDFALLKSLNITVKEGSLIPKDPLTQRNEAVDLWNAKALDPITFYKKLDFPDPVNAAQQLLIWQMVSSGALPPTAYIPSFMQGNPVGMQPIQMNQSTNPADGREQQPAQGLGTQPPEQAEAHSLIESVPESGFSQ